MSGQYLLHEAHGRVISTARPYQNGQQFGIGQGLSTLAHHLLARAVLFGPAVYRQLIYHSELNGYG